MIEKVFGLSKSLIKSINIFKEGNGVSMGGLMGNGSIIGRRVGGSVFFSEFMYGLS